MSSPMSFGGPTAPSEGGGSLRSDGDASRISLRPMRLKVLYTFDEQSAVNCLARWPHVVNVQTVELEDTSCIGVVELKTCLQAVVSASPELVAKLGHDYTVYAFDYSEMDTPLVGQGMLSWTLASASSSTQQARTFITGRVCQNALGLFMNGANETLEVKLRLKPVPTCQQSDFISSMDKYKEISKIMPPGFDATAWTAFLQDNPGLFDATGKLKATASNSVGTPRMDAGMEALGQLLHQGSLPDNLSQESNCLPPQSNHEVNDHAPFCSRVSSRGASPMPRAVSTSRITGLSQDRPSRPGSQETAIAANPGYETNSCLDTGGPPENDERLVGQDDGPAKKRARIMPADWSGRSSLVTNSEPLRVTASTAASIRVYRPIARRTVSAGCGPLEEPPRAPTPRPESAGGFHGRIRRTVGSGLAREAFQDQNVAPDSLPSLLTHDPNRGRSATAERGQANIDVFSPLSVGSSPPVLEGVRTAPSSPGLPTLPQQVDSGFMSGALEQSFDDDEMRPIDKEDLEIAAQYQKRGNPPASELSINEVTPGPPELLPRRILPRPVQRRGAVHADSTASEPAEMPEPSQKRTAPKPKKAAAPKKPPRKPRSSSVAKPKALAVTVTSDAPPRSTTPTQSKPLPRLEPYPASDPIRPAQNDRSQSGPGEPSTASISVTQEHTVGTGVMQSVNERPGLPRSGSGAKRKKAIQNRLTTAIQSGEMPPFCENCGAIETPTWRKSWGKRITGSPEDVVLSDEEGGVLAISEVKKDDTGKITSYCVVKKTLLDSDVGFKEVQFCNPCGLWLHKFKSMRPRERWSTDAKDANEKAKKPSKKKKQTGITTTTPPQNTGSQSDGTPDVDGALDGNDVVAIAATETGGAEEAQEGSATEPNQPTGGAEGNESRTHSSNALQPAFQSSPARVLGTRVSPIDVDELGSTRRILFPTPKKRASTSALQEISGNNRTQNKRPCHEKNQVASEPDASDVENIPPGSNTADDEIDKLFEDDGSEPSTPTRRSPASARSVRSAKHSTPSRHANRTSSPWKFDLFASTSQVETALTALLPRTPTSSRRSRSSRSTPRSMPGSAQYSPFTAQMRLLLAEANGTNTTTGSISPQQPFDFTALSSFADILPPLAGTGTGTSPGRATPAATTVSSTLHLPDLCHEDLFSTDVPMPSSPPPFFALYEDPVEATEALWSELNGDADPDEGLRGRDGEGKGEGDLCRERECGKGRGEGGALEAESGAAVVRDEVVSLGAEEV